MGLSVERQIPTVVQSNPASYQVTGRGLAGVDIMTKDSEELADDFHTKIRAARKARGWSQSDFARRINERANTIQKAENGIRPTDSVIRKIGKILNLRLFVDSMPKNTRMMASDDPREMTISDARDIPQEEERSKKGKKKGRRLGVSRSGARSRGQ
jgi:uncharacterized protein (TIGR00270 family)